MPLETKSDKRNERERERGKRRYQQQSQRSEAWISQRKLSVLSGTIDSFLTKSNAFRATRKPLPPLLPPAPFEPLSLVPLFSFGRLSTCRMYVPHFPSFFFSLFSRRARVDIGDVNGTAFQRTLKKGKRKKEKRERKRNIAQPDERRLTSRSVEYNYR